MISNNAKIFGEAQAGQGKFRKSVNIKNQKLK